MHSKHRLSLLTQTGIIIGIISLLAVIGISSSVFITQTIQGAGTTINTSGTLRMFAYKIATQMMRDQREEDPTSTDIRELISRFESQLNHPSLQHSIPQPSQNPKESDTVDLHPLYTLYNSIQWRWHEEIQPLLLSYAALLDMESGEESMGKLKHTIHNSYQQSYLSIIDDFVFDINNMVKLIEEQTESRIELLRNIAYVSLPLLLLSILAAPFLLYYRVLVPLKDLLEISQHVRQRDFSRQAKYTRKDELGELARAFNLMNSDLSATYAELEERIMEKTQALIDESNRITLMEERNIIAQELHDSLAQSIFYINIQISRIKTLIRREAPPSQLLPIIYEFATTNDEADRQLRELISTFRIKINPEGLTAAINEIITKYMGRESVTLKFYNHIPDFSFTHSEEVNMIQITQEAISNIIKHANATSGTIVLDHDGENNLVTLTIDDDGGGIPENPYRHNHFGLKNMEERAENINGNISIYQQADGGTRIELDFNPALTQESRL